MLKRNHEKMIGNDKFEGFIIDLLDDLQRQLNFSGYSIFLGHDGSYGLPYGNGTWNDVIGNLVNQKADLAVGDLTITRERQEQIDFTIPFINFGISIIARKSENQVTSLTAFLNPFSFQLWYSIGLASLWVTLMMHFLGRFSPLEWIIDESSLVVNKNPNGNQTSLIIIQSANNSVTRTKSKNVMLAKNNFNFSNCAWFTLCSIMQQSSDLSLR